MVFNELNTKFTHTLYKGNFMFYREVNYHHYLIGAVVFGTIFLNSAKIESSDWVSGAGVAAVICLGFGVSTLLRYARNTKEDLRAATEFARESELRTEFTDRISELERTIRRMNEKV
jgi:hypothetical protein